MEKNEVYAGLQISPQGVQISWFDYNLSEPKTLPLKDTGEDAMKELPVGVWKGIALGGSYSGESLKAFLRETLEQIPGLNDMSQLRVCVTVPSLKQKMSDNLAAALTGLGIERRRISFQDWRTSFYYYVVNKPRDLWSGDVAFFEYKDEKMIGYILHIDRTRRPALVTISEVSSEDVSGSVRGSMSDEDWDRERDRLFYELLGRVFERRNVRTSYLYGNYFSNSWARRSFQYLTFRRHAFQGQNLFSKGACCGAMAREKLIQMPDMIFAGVDMVTENLGMELRVKGREQYYALVQAGINWYEAHSVFEFIPDDEKSICIQSSPMNGGTLVRHVLRLDHFPERKNRASRLRMTLYFVSVRECMVEVEDLGFGGFYQPTGRIWKRKILLAEPDQDKVLIGPDREGAKDES